MHTDGISTTLVPVFSLGADVCIRPGSPVSPGGLAPTQRIRSEGPVQLVAGGETRVCVVFPQSRSGVGAVVCGVSRRPAEPS